VIVADFNQVVGLLDHRQQDAQVFGNPNKGVQTISSSLKRHW
jgi:hypothetical protein